MPIIFPRFPKVVLTGDADPGNVMLGKTFYKDDYKQKLTGTYVPAAPPVLDGDAGPGDVLAGKTFYKDDAYTKLTGTIPSKAAATITPGTVDQVIAAGQYLSGAQTIAGSANLVAGNIKNGVNIFGVVGSATTINAIAGDTVVAENLAPISTTSTAWVVVKQFIINISGSIRVTFGLNVDGYGQRVYGRVYKNGTPVGIERMTFVTTPEVFTEDFTVSQGDYIQLYCKTSNPSYPAYVSNFKLAVGNAFTYATIV